MEPTILVVDDDPFIRDVFKTHLGGEGYNVITADGYQSALDVIDSISLDAIILDVYLVGKSGVDILRAVSDRKMICPIIVVTGKPDFETAAEVFRTGAFDFLVKPVNPVQIFSAIKRLFEGRRIQESQLTQDYIAEYGQVVKPYPSCGYTHRVIDCARELRQRVPALERVRGIRIQLPDFHAAILPFMQPGNRHEALFSLLQKQCSMESLDFCLRSDFLHSFTWFRYNDYLCQLSSQKDKSCW